MIYDGFYFPQENIWMTTFHYCLNILLMKIFHLEIISLQLMTFRYDLRTWSCQDNAETEIFTIGNNQTINKNKISFNQDQVSRHWSICCDISFVWRNLLLEWSGRISEHWSPLHSTPPTTRHCSADHQFHSVRRQADHGVSKVKIQGVFQP